MGKSLVCALALLLALGAPASAAFDPHRIVTAVDYDAKSFSCRAKAGAPTYTYKLTSNTRIRVKGERPRLTHLWEKGSFSQVKVGERVTVQYHLSGHDRIAERIAIYPAKK
jgi:hypothetical protein